MYWQYPELLFFFLSHPSARVTEFKKMELVLSLCFFCFPLGVAILFLFFGSPWCTLLRSATFWPYVMDRRPVSGLVLRLCKCGRSSRGADGGAQPNQPHSPTCDQEGRPCLLSLPLSLSLSLFLFSLVGRSSSYCHFIVFTLRLTSRRTSASRRTRKGKTNIDQPEERTDGRATTQQGHTDFVSIISAVGARTALRSPTAVSGRIGSSSRCVGSDSPVAPLKAAMMMTRAASDGRTWADSVSLRGPTQTNDLLMNHPSGRPPPSRRRRFPLAATSFIGAEPNRPISAPAPIS